MKMIQVRNVPEDLHRALKERAAREGSSMSDLILDELPRLAHRPSNVEILRRARDRPSAAGTPAAELIRADRDGH